jgi:hypothetical protein
MVSSRKKVIIFFLLLMLLSAWVVFEGLSQDPTFSRLTNFLSLQSLYQPLKDDANVHIIAAYPMGVSNVTFGFPPNYQLLGQMIHNKTLVGGFDTFTPNGQKIQSMMSDISNPQTISQLARFKVDTIVIYDQLLDYAAETVQRLKQDKRLSYLGSYAVPYDKYSVYVSTNDLSRSISVFQINEVAADQSNRSDIYADSGEIQISRRTAHKTFLTVSGIFDDGKIYFSQPYSSHWKLYVKKRSFLPEGITYLWRQPIFDNTHQMIEEYGNSWSINYDDLLKDRNENYYRLNNDGSIDLELVLYFKIEAYYIIGRSIAVITCLICLGYLLWEAVKKRVKETGRDNNN